MSMLSNLLVRRAVIAGVGAAVALAAAPAAQATDYCVAPADGCTAANTFVDTGAGLQAALDAAGASPNADRIFIGAGRYMPAAGFVYNHPNAPVELIGQGPKVTSLAAGGTAGTALDLNGGPASTVRDLTVDLPYKNSGSYPVALDLYDGTAYDVNVIPDPLAPPATFGANAVELTGAHFDSGTVDLPTTGHFAGIGSLGPNNTVTNTAVTAGLPININDDQATLSRLRLFGGTANDAVSVRATGVELADSLIVQPGTDTAVVAGTGNGTDAGITLDHDTIIGDGSLGSRGVMSDAGSLNSQVATVTMRNSIIRGFAHSLSRIVMVGGGTATVAASYSDYDPSGDQTIGTGGSGSFVDAGGNINADPHFLTPGSDYRLAPGSPAIDAGDPSGLLGGEPSVDLAGLPRIVDAAGGCPGRSDMGAYELQAPASAPTAHAVLVGGATAGAAATFDGSATSEPDTKAFTYAWTFDDGGTATGTVVHHAFSTTGTHVATLAVSDLCGRDGSQTISFAVASPPPPVVRPPVVRPLVLSQLTAAPYHLMIARNRVLPTHAPKVRYRLSALASVQPRLVRLVLGYRRSGACRAGGRGPACPILRSLATLHADGRAGANMFALPRKGHGWSLTPGRYEVIVTAHNAANGSSKQLVVRFTVTPAPRRR